MAWGIFALLFTPPPVLGSGTRIGVDLARSPQPARRQAHAHPARATVQADKCAQYQVYNEGMACSAVARNGTAPEDAHTRRAQALADAEGLLRAENLEMSTEHRVLAARWVAGEIDSAQLEQLGLDLVGQ
jgi:hypothetical protein